MYFARSIYGRKRHSSKPPPPGEVARLAVTEGVRLIHPANSRDRQCILRGDTGKTIAIILRMAEIKAYLYG